MEFSFLHLKKALYILMGILGAWLLITAYTFFNMSGSEAEPISLIISGIVLTFAGTVCMFFAFETFLIRDDPEVWR
ncbi:MAG: hypothetical protein K2X81_16395 [Candidatus Obscuribacterales bacterium]|nr:hypothetical protein [Candidatus Obscuribacterales bacterium]